METFGDRLKSEREGRGLSIQDVAEALGLDDDWLQALERNEFDRLPDESVMTGCLQAYAARLEVDAELMIEDYVQEREKCLRQLANALPDANVENEPAVEVAPTVEIAPTTVTSTASRRSGFPRAVSGLLILAVIGIVAAWWMLSGDGTASKSTPSEPTVVVETPVVAAPIETEPAPPVQRPEIAGALTIEDHGVGTAVEDRQLVGRGDRFAEGDQVWFWTRVMGGSRGDRIDHVWLQDGVEQARISLKLGGSRWRTQSAKMLHAGSVGDWAVEARDDTGRVLARSDFACTP
jgi:transcriptional regulator with XRE-family HTH domain